MYWIKSATLFVSIATLSAVARVMSPDDLLCPPPAVRGSDVDVLHGEVVADPYRALEDLESPATREWISKQDEILRTYVEGPALVRARDSVERFAVDTRYGTPVKRGTRLYFLSFAANGVSNRQLLVMPDEGGSPQVLIGRNQLEPDDSLVSVSASPDGRYIAYTTAHGASRWLRLFIWDTRDHRRLSDTLEGLHTSMATITWDRDRAFYYARFPRPPAGEEMSASVTRQTIVQHRVGTSQADDKVVWGPGDEPTRWYLPRVTDDGRYLVIRSAVGSNLREGLFVRDLAVSGSRVRELKTGTNAQLIVIGNDGPRLIVQTDAGAPRHRLVSIDLERPDEPRWQTVIAEPPPNERIVYANVVADRVIVFRVRDAEPLATIHTMDGQYERTIPLPPLTTVWGPGGGGPGFLGRRGDDETFFVTNSFADPGTVYRLNPRSGRLSEVISPQKAFDSSAFVGERTFYTSKDGTRIPIFIARRKDTPIDGTRAVLMYGYGALAWSAFPWFQPQVLAWLDAGGIYALPSIRGGGEYGEAWHEAGRREHRQTAIDDYIAAAQWLAANNYARPDHVVANGGSLSGFVAAAAILQQPRAFGAALLDIPVLDLLRYDRVTGAAMWVDEIGSPRDPVQFRSLRAISPYHNVGDQRCTPPTLMTAGERDETAAPWHAYKYTAALQGAQSCEKPVLLQIAWGAGHTFGTDAVTSRETWARQVAFLWRVLDDDSSAGGSAASPE